MDVHHHHHHHHPPYAPSDGHLPPAYDPSHPHPHSLSYEAQYYSPYPQPQYEYHPSAAYPPHHHQYYDYSAAYQPPPPGVDHAHPHHYLPPPQPQLQLQPDAAMEVAAGFSHEYAVPMVDGGSGGASSQGGGSGGRFPSRSRGGRGSIGRGNFRGRGRGRGGGRAHNPPQIQPPKPKPNPKPKPKPAREPTPHAWCEICRVDCNSVEILEQHRAGKRHKRTVQRILEYEAQQEQQKQLPVAAAVALEQKEEEEEEKTVVEIREEEQKEEEEETVVGQNQPGTDAPTLGKQSSFTKRHRDTIYGHGRRGGNKIRRFGGERQRERPIVCMLCNVTCNTAAVFETHVAGKKHTSRINKCRGGSNQVFGPLTVFIPPGQPVIRPQNGLELEPVFYGLTINEEIERREMVMVNDGLDVAMIDNGINDGGVAAEEKHDTEVVPNE